MRYAILHDIDDMQYGLPDRPNAMLHDMRYVHGDMLYDMQYELGDMPCDVLNEAVYMRCDVPYVRCQMLYCMIYGACRCATRYAIWTRQYAI